MNHEELLITYIQSLESQIQRYDVYVKMLISKDHNSILQTEKLLNFDDTLNSNIDNIPHDLIVSLLESCNVSKLIELSIQGPIVHYTGSVCKISKNGTTISESVSQISQIICNALLKKITPIASKLSKAYEDEHLKHDGDGIIADDEHSKDTLRVNTIMDLKSKENQVKICKKVFIKQRD